MITETISPGAEKSESVADNSRGRTKPLAPRRRPALPGETSVNPGRALVPRGDPYELQVERAIRSAECGVRSGECRRARTLNPTRFINAAAVKELALETAKALRPFHRFNRVSKAFLVEISEEVRRSVVARVKRLPSKGKTI